LSRFTESFWIGGCVAVETYFSGWCLFRCLVLFNSIMRGGKIMICALAGLTFASGAKALVTEPSPFRGIVERNVFGLKPITPTVSAPAVPPAPPSKITLNGITTILGNKRALLSVQAPGKPVESFILAEGQRDGGVEVKTIDEKNGSIEVDNHGVAQTISFKDDGAKLSPTAAPPPSLPPVTPHVNFPHIPPPAGNNAMRVIPTRTMRVPTPPSSSPPNAGIGGGAVNNLASQAQFQNHITPEDQVIMIEAQRMKLQQEGKTAEANLFPTTEMTPGSGPENSPSQSQF
jgi:hypothetical protein